MSKDHVELLPKVKWKKILYQKQPFPDNFTDREQFLIGLERNRYKKVYSLRQMKYDSLIVINQIAIVLLFVTSFLNVFEGNVSVSVFIGLDFILISFGLFSSPLRREHSYWIDILKILTYNLALYFSAPLTLALTKSVSDDTIILITTILLLVFLIFQDYFLFSRTHLPINTRWSLSSSVKNHSTTIHLHNNADSINRTLISPSTSSKNPTYNAPIAMNASIAASLIMISRLSTPIEAYAFTSFAVILFILFPVHWYPLQKLRPSHSILLTSTLVISSSLLLYILSSILMFLYLLCIFCIIFLVPLFLQYMQIYKDQVHGPWEEASV